MRKLEAGDIITLIADLREGWVDIVVNFGEHVVRFELDTILAGHPRGPSVSFRDMNFVMGVTLSKQQQFTILPSSYSVLKHLNEADPRNARDMRAHGVSSRYRPECGNCGDTCERCRGVPHSYGSSSNVSCDVCDRNHIHLDRVSIYHCSDCGFDVCFICHAESVGTGSGSDSDNSSDDDDDDDDDSIIGDITEACMTISDSGDDRRRSGRERARGAVSGPSRELAAPQGAYGPLYDTATASADGEHGPAHSALEQLLDLARVEIRASASAPRSSSGGGGGNGLGTAEGVDIITCCHHLRLLTHGWAQ